MSYFKCSKCGKVVSSVIPGGAERVTIRAWIECPECIAAGREAVWRKRCPKDYRNTEPTQVPDRKAFETATGWQFNPRGLLLHGETGAGKSRAAWFLLRRLIAEGHVPITFNSGDFADAMREVPDLGAWKRRLFVWPLVYIDDLGNGYKTRFWEDVTFHVVCRRAENHVPLIITTQYTGEDLMRGSESDIRAAALVRRLRESDFFETIPFEKGK